MGSDANFAAVRSTAPSGRAEGSANLDSDPKNPCSRQAGSSSNSLRCTSLKQSLALIRLPLRCSALPHGVGEWGRKRMRLRSRVFLGSTQIRRAFSAPCGCFAAKLRSDPKNQAAPRSGKCFRYIAPVIRAQSAMKIVAFRLTKHQILAGFFRVSIRSSAFSTIDFTSSPCRTVKVISASGLARSQIFL